MPITAPPVHPLSRSAISQRDTHVHPPQRDADRSDKDREEALSDTALSAGAFRKSKNPFNGVAQPPSLPASLAATPLVSPQAQYSPVTPPVPPRKPPALPPRTSDATAATLITLSPSLPPRPPKTTAGGGAAGGNGPASSSLPPINSSSLIKESLRAAKGAQAQKASETLLEKTLNWEVIKRSSSRDAPLSGSGGVSNDVSKGVSGRNTSPTRPPPPIPPQPRRTAPSPPISASSMEVLASASLPLTPQNRYVGDSGNEAGTIVSSKPGLGRSKSMHHHTSPSVSATMQSPLFTQQQRTSPVPPPPPRRRPESFQALPAYGSSTDAGSIGNGYLPSYLPSDGRGPGLSRRASIQSNITHSTDASGNNGGGPHVGAGAEKDKERAGRGDAFAHLYESVKKRAEGLQRGAQPGFENMRRIAERAEGRVVPGGYIHPRRGSSHRAGSERRGLVSGEGDNGEEGDDEDGRGGVDVDDGSPGVDVDDREWREWDRTVRQDDGRRGRPRLSNGPGMDFEEGDATRRSDRLSPQGSGWRRL